MGSCGVGEINGLVDGWLGPLAVDVFCGFVRPTWKRLSYFPFPNTEHVPSHEKIFHNQARALIINCSRYFTKKQERQHKKEH
jgi:hypothetical protein